MCAASLLSKEGLRVALVEQRSLLGGRFSTVHPKGFRCAVGGVAVPVGHNLEAVCDEIGVPTGVKPVTSVAVWLDGELHDLTQGGTRGVIRRVAPEEEALRVIEGLNAAMVESPPSGVTFTEWLNRFSENPRIHGMFQATISSLLTVNSWELDARVYFELIRTISPLTFGFVEGGSVALWGRMAEYIRARGGMVVNSAIVDGIEVEGANVVGVRYRQAGRELRISAPLVVSNAGPSATVRFVGPENLPGDYVELVQEKTQPTAILWLHFASAERVLDYSAISLGCTRRINMIDAPSYEVDGVAPEGMHLFTVGAAPLDSSHVDDVEAEFEEVMADLRDVIWRFDDRCEVLAKTCYQGRWPGFRTTPGNHLGHRTPIDGLFNVGDAACPPGYFGSMGAAKSAQDVRDDIVT